MPEGEEIDVDEDGSGSRVGGGRAAGSSLGAEPIDSNRAAREFDRATEMREMGSRGPIDDPQAHGANMQYGKLPAKSAEALRQDYEQPDSAFMQNFKDKSPQDKAGIGKACLAVIGVATVALLAGIGAITAGALTNWFSGQPPPNDPDQPGANDDFVIGDKPGDAVTIDVLKNDLVTDAGLDPASVTIVGAPGDGRTLSVPGEGVWTVDAKSGAITFAPDKALADDPRPIRYTMADKRGSRSKPATVRLYYTATAISLDNAPGKAVTVDILSALAPSDRANAKAVEPISDAAVTGQGRWTIGSNLSVTFTPDANFVLDPTPALFEIRDAAGKPIDRIRARVEYRYVLPNVNNDLVEGYGGLANPLANQPTRMAKPVTVDVLANDVAGTFAIDPATVLIQGTVTMMGEVAPRSSLTDTVNSATGALVGGRTLDVDTQGKWTVDKISGAITFTPATGFTDTPTAIRYSVADVKSARSGFAVVVVNEAIADIRKALANSVAKNDATFWADYVARLITPAPDLDVIFLSTLTLADATGAAIGAADPTLLKRILGDPANPADDGLQIVGGAVTPLFNAWGRAAFSPAELYAQVDKAVTDQSTGLAGLALGTRLLKLQLILRMCRRYYRAL